METEELEDTMEVVHGSNDIENLEENKSCDRKESLFGVTKSRICESCEKIQKCMSLGQSVRRCQACAKKKDLMEKKPSHDLRGEGLIGEERQLEMDYDPNEEPLVVATSKFVMEVNMTSEEHWNDSMKVSCNENFAMEHGHVDILDVDVVKALNPIRNEDGKVVKKKESVMSNKKEYKTMIATDPTLKKEKFGYSKGRSLLEKDTAIPNERREQIVEILDVQKTKDEIELERRERGWIVNGRNASHPKVMPMKTAIMLDGYSPGKERRERGKVKTLKEKSDTQRILGLVARRSESRITSPTHKRDPNFKRDDEVEAPYTISMINNVLPSLTLHEKNCETSKSRETHYKIATHSDSGSTRDENEGKTLCLDIEEGVPKAQPHITQQDSNSKCSSPTNLSCYANDNPLYGTQRILELLAKRNGSRVTSPKQSLETKIIEGESINTRGGESTEQNQIKKTNVIFHSSKLHDQQQEDSLIGVILPQTSKNSYNDNDLLWNNTKEKVLSLNYGVGLGRQIYDTHQNIESNFTLPTNTSCRFNDNPLYGTHRILELIAHRSESNTTSPKRSLNSDTQENSLTYVRENEFSKLDDNMKTNNVAHPLYSTENQVVTPTKITHLNSTLFNHNESTHENIEGTLEMTVHSNIEHKISKSQLEQDLSRQNSPVSNFSTHSSTICHVNDRPLYGSKFESEPSTCTFSNTNENHLRTLNPLPSPIVHGLFGKPLNNPLQEASKICDKKECTTSPVKNSSIYNSSEMTPLYKSVIATPICKLPELNQKTNITFLQIEPKLYKKEVEIVEEESSLMLIYDGQLKKNTEIEEPKNKKSKKKNGRCRSESCSTLNISNTKNTSMLGSAKDGLKKKSNEENAMISHYNLKAASYKNTSKGQIILWPMHILFRSLTYPFKLVLKLMLFFVYILRSFFFGIIRHFKMLKKITSIGVGNIRSRILKHSQNGCNNSQRYSGCGCATKTYILIVLSSLLLPSLFDLDFYLVNRFIEGQVVIREPLNFDYTKEHPIAMVNLLPQQIMGKAKGYFPDKEVMAAHAFPPSHIFHMIVHLTVPESQYNHEIGMFQVVVETFSARGHSLNKASQASMLRYHSPPVKYIKSVIMGIPIVLGLCQESQTLSIRVMESQNENEHSPTASVHVEIEPKAGHLTDLGVPEIYQGELQVIAHNPYLREVARNWVWSLYVYSGVALFVFEALLVLCCCRRIFPQKLGNKDTIEDFLTKDKKVVLEEGPKNMQAPRRLHRRHIYFPKNLPLALPSTSNVIDSKGVAKCDKISVEEFKSQG